MNHRFFYVGLIILLAIFLVIVPGTSKSNAAPVSIEGLHVSGNAIVNGDNQPLRLLGVNRSGAEFACVENKGIWDGPTDADSVQALLSWNINTVRIPMNEDCWLGINGINPAYSGAKYRQEIVKFVKLLNDNGLIVILDLHWSAPGKDKASGQNAMPDKDHTPAFWKSVAGTFKDSSAVIFDLFNEPFPERNSTMESGWKCWQMGGTCQGIAYAVAGMQELVDTVRSTGAANIILLGGVAYSNSVAQWLAHKPTDPKGNLAASWHVYNFNGCVNATCWDKELAPVLAKVPLVAGEIGQRGCGHDFIDKVMDWLDAHKASYLAWTWNTWDCDKGPALIADYQGTPTTYGEGLRNRLAQLSGNATPSAATPESETIFNTEKLSQ